MTTTIAFIVLIFVTLAVAGFRAIDLLDKAKAESAAKARKGVEYKGPRYTAHGREKA